MSLVYIFKKIHSLNSIKVKISNRNSKITKNSQIELRTPQKGFKGADIFL